MKQNPSTFLPMAHCMINIHSGCLFFPSLFKKVYLHIKVISPPSWPGQGGRHISLWFFYRDPFFFIFGEGRFRKVVEMKYGPYSLHCGKSRWCGKLPLKPCVRNSCTSDYKCFWWTACKVDIFARVQFLQELHPILDIGNAHNYSEETSWF